MAAVKGVTVMEGIVRTSQLVVRGNKKKLAPNPNLKIITINWSILNCGDSEIWITWREQFSEENGIGTSEGWRRDAVIVGKVVRPVPRTSP